MDVSAAGGGARAGGISVMMGNVGRGGCCIGGSGGMEGGVWV